MALMAARFFCPFLSCIEIMTLDDLIAKETDER